MTAQTEVKIVSVNCVHSHKRTYEIIGDSGSVSNEHESKFDEFNLNVDSSVCTFTRHCCPLDDDDVHDVNGDASGE